MRPTSSSYSLHVIAVEPAAEAWQRMSELELRIMPQQLIQTVNDRHLGLLSDGADRLIALHWFDANHALLVDSVVTKATRDVHGIQLHAVRANLAIWIRPQMPGGMITREMNLHDVLYAIAKSFGSSVTCHPHRSSSFLYAGPWDGTFPRVIGNASGSILLGTFDRKRKACELVWALDITRYTAWFKQCLAPAIASLSRSSPDRLVLAQKYLLETLFDGVSWFESQRRRGSDHPALQRWILCKELLARDCIFRMPTDTHLAHQLLEIMADSNNLVECTSGDRPALTLGDLANYGDAAVVNRLRTVIHHKTQFFDVLLEIACAAWHTTKGHTVHATEDAGMPDLCITVPDWNRPVYAECKRLSAQVAHRRLRSVVGKANKQLRQTTDVGFGVVYLDISACVRDCERTSDDVPQEVATIATNVETLLQRDYHAVSALVLLWKQHETRFYDSRIAGCSMLYRSRIARHRQPRVRLPIETDPIMIEQTLMLRIDEHASCAVPTRKK